jgi:hypothetical protein
MTQYVGSFIIVNCINEPPSPSSTGLYASLVQGAKQTLRVGCELALSAGYRPLEQTINLTYGYGRNKTDILVNTNSSQAPVSTWRRTLMS